jgi:hypothetical protein
VLAALGVAVLGIQLVYFWVPGMEIVALSGDLSLPLTVLALVAMVNAMNLIDGLDGLAAGVAAIAATAFFLFAVVSEPSGPAGSIPSSATLIAAIVVGISLGFLVHNWHPATIFMGDTGSLLLGLLLGAAGVSYVGRTTAPTSVDFFGSIPLLVPGARPRDPVPRRRVRGRAARAVRPAARIRRPRPPAPPAAGVRALAPPGGAGAAVLVRRARLRVGGAGLPERGGAAAVARGRGDRRARDHRPRRAGPPAPPARARAARSTVDPAGASPAGPCGRPRRGAAVDPDVPLRGDAVRPGSVGRAVRCAGGGQPGEACANPPRAARGAGRGGPPFGSPCEPLLACERHG